MIWIPFRPRLPMGRDTLLSSSLRGFRFVTHVTYREACPNPKICLSHGGGFTCYGIARMDRGWQGLPSDGSKITQPPSRYIRRFYSDCIVYSEAALRYLY